MKESSFSVPDEKVILKIPFPDEGDTSHKKPYLSIAQLIAEALNNAPGKTLVLSDIYKAINAKYPYYTGMYPQGRPVRPWSHLNFQIP